MHLRHPLLFYWTPDSRVTDRQVPSSASFLSIEDLRSENLGHSLLDASFTQSRGRGADGWGDVDRGGRGR